MKKDEPGSSSLYFKIFNIQPRKGDRRKLQIVEAAIELLSQQGLEHLSLESIGSRLKIPRAHVSYYFKTREDVLDAVFQYVFAIGQEVTVKKIGSAKTPKELLAHIVGAPFDWIEHYSGHAAIFLLLSYFSAIHPNKKKLFQEVRDAGLARFREGVQRILDQDPRLAKASVEDLSTRLYAATFGYFVFACSSPNTARIRTFRRKALRNMRDSMY